MLNMVSAYIGTSYLSNSTNRVATSSCPLPTPPPTFYNDTKISSPNLHTLPVYHLPQLLREPNISSHPSQQRGLAVTSNNTAATTFERSSTTKSTTLPPNISTSCQVYYYHKHLTPSSPFATANHYTDYHLGYLSLLANVNFASHSLTQLINPSAHADVASTPLVIPSSNAGTSTKLALVTQSAIILHPTLHLSTPWLGTCYPHQNLM